MQRFFKISLLSFLISSGLLSQINAQSIRWGSKASANRASGALYSLGWHNNYLYNIEKELEGNMKMGGNIRLEKLSNDMKLVFSKELKIEKVIGSSSSHYQIVDDKLHVYNLKNFGKSNGGIQLIQDVFDLNGNYKKKNEIAGLKGIKGLHTTLKYKIANSIDEDRVGLVICKKVKKEKKKVEVRLYSFDNNGENLREFTQVFSSDIKVTSIKIKKFLIDKNDNLILYYDIWDDFQNPALGKTISKEKLLIVSKEGNVISNISLEKNGSLLGGLNLKLAEDNSLYFTGFLGVRKDKKVKYVGFFIGKFNSKTFEIETIKEYAYTEDFFKSLGYKVKKDGEIRFRGQYKLDIFLNDQGGGYFVANHKSYYRSTGIVNKELLVIPFDSDLAMGDIQVIPRHLNSYKPLLNGLGYFAFIREGALNIVYTDNKENLKVNELEKARETANPMGGGAAIIIAEIDGNNPVRRSVLSKENKINGYLLPKKCHANESKFVVNIGNRGKVLYGEILFD